MYNRGSKRSAKRTTTAKKKYRQQVIEALETRQLLTTLYGGGAGQAQTYFFATDGSAVNNARIDIYGDVVAEFIFMHGPTGEVVNRTLNGTTLGLNVFSDSTTTATGSNIFSIYVSKSDINSYIAITAIDPTTGAIQPFGGSQPFDISPANGRGPDTAVATPGGAGSLVLGARDAGTVLNRPIIKTDINGAAFGVRPAGLDDLPEDPTSDLSAGLRVANGQDLGKFLFGGEIYGKVRVDGSMNLFYGGWILTGDARGATDGVGVSGLPVSQRDTFATAQDTALGEARHIVPQQNFYVGGDLQNLITAGPIGWDGTYGTGTVNPRPFFVSGTDIYVRGRLGNVQSNAGYAASIHVGNVAPGVTTFARPTTTQEEVEGFNQGDFTGGFLLQPASGRSVVPFGNDTFDQFQFLGSFNSALGKDVIDVIGVTDSTGQPDRDPVDYYGVSLLAGQTVRVVLYGNSHVGVFDPDGRLIASDFNDVNSVAAVPFEFTADRPGIYRVAVDASGDGNFLGGGSTALQDQYELVITNAGNLAVGGVKVLGTALDMSNGRPAFQSDAGDFGAVYTSDLFRVTAAKVYQPTSPPLPNTINPAIVLGTIIVANGNLRAVDADGIGWAVTDNGSSGSDDGTAQDNGVTFVGGSAPDLIVPAGSVGLVQSRTAQLLLNPSALFNFQAPLTIPNQGPSTPVALTLAQVSIGQNYQLIHAAGVFAGGVVANGGLGVLRAGAMNTEPYSAYINLDADQTGFDGVCDLIDVAGDFGTLNGGGPALLHGPGGNFRYLRVGGTSFPDYYFGGGQTQRVTQAMGQSVTFTDDSGSTITFTPVGPSVDNPFFNPLDPSTGPVRLSPRLTTRVYPVRSGGVIVMDVASTGSIAISANAGAYGGSAEVSRVEVHGDAPAPTRSTPVGRVSTPQVTNLALPLGLTPSQQLTVTISGSTRVDVAYIGVLTAEPGFLNAGVPVSSVSTFGNATSISNSTGGEIVSVNAASIGTLYSHGTIGLTKSSIPGNSVNFIESISIGSAYAARVLDGAGEMPVNPVGTDIGSAYPFHLQTYGIVVNGDIVSIRADQGLGNIVAAGIIGSVVANADKKNVSGAFEGISGPIWTRGVNAELLYVQIGEGLAWSGSGDYARSGLYSDYLIGTVTNQGAGSDIRGNIVSGHYIQNISLNNGSIIDANIVEILNTQFALTRETSSTITIPTDFNETQQIYQLGRITLTGNGGIIGSVFIAANIGPVTVGGFGIFSSFFTVLGQGRIAQVTAGGYGVRDTTFQGGAFMNGINATGNGSNLPTYKVSSSVRQSEITQADVQLGYGFDPFSGRALSVGNDIHAFLGTSQAVPVINGVTDTGVLELVQAIGQRSLGTVTAQTIRGDSIFNFGDSIDTIKTRGLINGLYVITGRIKKFLPGGNVGNLHMTLSGTLNNLTIKGNLDKGSVIEAIGPNGKIGNITVTKNVDGTIHAVQTIGTVKIGGNLNGSLKVDALARNKMALKKLQVGGTISNGALDIGATGNVANVGQIIVGKSLGASDTDSLHVSGSIDRLQVGGTLKASVNVGKEIKTLQAQRIDGTVTAGDIKNLFIKSGGLRGDLTLRNKLQNANIAGGVFADISANNGIGNVTVSGNVAPGTTIESGFGGIGKLRVSGDLDGGVSANGKIDQIVVGRNLGDGVTPLTISAARLGLLQVAKSIKAGVTVDIGGPIDALVIGGDIDAGAVVQASAISRQQINGEVFGSLLIG